MALGAVDVSPLEMAQAYTPLSNGGWSARAFGIERIRTRKGRVIYERRADPAARAGVLGNPPLRDMNSMLRRVVASGTGTRANVPGYDLAGKTGTTSDYRDAWFVGYTGGFTTAVWVGKDDNKPMGKVTGGSAPAKIWHDFMASALPRLQVKPIPDGPANAPFINDPIGDLLAAGDLDDFFGEMIPVETDVFGADRAVAQAPAAPQPYVPAPSRPPPTLPPEAEAALEDLIANGV
jgi:penicillin-binding protein 1A